MALVFLLVFVLPSLIWLICLPILLTYQWCLVGFVVGLFVFLQHVPHDDASETAANSQKSGMRSGVSRLAPYLLMVAGVIFVTAIEVRPYVEFGLIPVGWDTAQHLYRARLIIDGNLEGMMELSGGNSFLPYLIVAALSLGNPEYLFIARILVVFILSFSLFFTVMHSAIVKYGSLRESLPAALVCFVWFSLYRLSADLHKTLLALIFLIPLLGMYTSKMNRRSCITISLLSFAISISQIEMTVLLIGAATVLEVIVFPRGQGLRDAITRWLSIVLPSIPALLIALIYDTRFVTVAVYYEEVLLAPDSQIVSYALGVVLIPLSTIGALSYLSELRSSTRATSLLPVFTIVILIFVVVPSFFLATPSLFRKMAPRALTVLPLPFLVTDGLRRVRSLYRGTSLSKTGRLLSRNSCTAGLILLVSLAAATTPAMAAVHHRPFMSMETYDELNALRDQHPDDPFVFITRGKGGYQYLNDGWVGTILGSHFAWHGPVVYLVAGVPYPLKSPVDKYHSDRAFAVLNATGLTFPLTYAGVGIYTTTSLYGAFDSCEAASATELSEHVYSFDADSRLSLLRNYTQNPSEPFEYQGSWIFDSYALLLSDEVAGTEFITYPLLFADPGTYCVSIAIRDGFTNLSRVTVCIDGQFQEEICYHGSETIRVFQWLCNSTGTGVHFIKFYLADPGSPGELIIYSIGVARIDVLTADPKSCAG